MLELNYIYLDVNKCITRQMLKHMGASLSVYRTCVKTCDHVQLYRWTCQRQPARVESHLIIRGKSHCMSQTQLFHSAICAFINLASLSSVVSICLLNLSCCLLFLSLSSLVAMLHHVFCLSVFAAYSLLHVTLVYSGVGFPCSHHVFSCTRRSYDSRMMTTQCGAFRVRNVNFHAHDTPTMLASTTDQCRARSGSPQLLS